MHSLKGHSSDTYYVPTQCHVLVLRLQQGTAGMRSLPSESLSSLLGNMGRKKLTELVNI